MTVVFSYALINQRTLLPLHMRCYYYFTREQGSSIAVCNCFLSVLVFTTKGQGERLAKGWTVRGLNLCVVDIFHARPDRVWVQPPFYTMGTLSLPG